MNRLKMLLALLYLPVVLEAQPMLKNDTGRIRPEMYIEMFREAAIEDMMKTGVPASITLAQGMYESDYGNSDLARKANNHFGIKCHKGWEGETFHKDDDAPNECFRKYKSVLESYDDHSSFLRSRERYASLFTLETTDYKGWAHGLKKAGYATNPQYAQKLIDLIERYRLHEYDQQGGKQPLARAERPEPAKEQAIKNTFSNKDQRTVADAKTVNGVPFVIARKGDTWTKLAQENTLDLWQILEYNDATKTDILREGERVYVKPKRKRSGAVSEHLLQENETMRDVAQQYGIRLRKLYRMNEMEPGTRPAPGTRIYLNRSMLFGIVL